MGGINHQKRVVYYCYTHIIAAALSIFVVQNQHPVELLESDRMSTLGTRTEGPVHHAPVTVDHHGSPWVAMGQEQDDDGEGEIRQTRR